MKQQRINKMVYNESYKFLLKMVAENGISEKSLAKYFKCKKIATIEEVFEKLVSTAQNYTRMSNIVKFNDRQQAICHILCEYDIKKVLKKYDTDKLYEIFCKKFKITPKKNPNSLLRKWCKSVISSAHFLNEFKNLSEFNAFIRKHRKDAETRWDLAKKIEKKITGIGVVTACNFLKDIGYANFSKPDIHLIDVFANVVLPKDKHVSKLSKKSLLKKYEKKVFLAIDKMAVDCKVTPYKVDRIFWLICSGHFNLPKDVKKVKGKKTELIKQLKKLLRKPT